MRAYAKAGSVAQEALSALRTVLANNAIRFVIERYFIINIKNSSYVRTFLICSYTSYLDLVRQHTMKKSFLFGTIYSTLKTMLYFFYAICLISSIFIFRRLPEEYQTSINDIVTVSELD